MADIFKRKNKHFNAFVVIDLVENEVLHNIIWFLFQKLFKFRSGRWWPSCILAAHMFPENCSRGSPPRLCSYTCRFVDINFIGRPFTACRVYLPGKSVWPWLLLELKLFRSRAMAYWPVTMVTLLSVGCKLNLQMIQWLCITRRSRILW